MEITDSDLRIIRGFTTGKIKMVFINIPKSKVTLDLSLDFKLSEEVPLMIECF